MGEEYVVDGAKLNCEFGSKLSRLVVPKHRHIKVNGKLLANKSDVNLGQNCILSFGNCSCSSSSNYTFIEDASEEDISIIPYGRTIEHKHQRMLAADVTACSPDVVIPWLSAKEDVFAADIDAVLKSSWTICNRGGYITIVTSGQEEESLESVLDTMNELYQYIEKYLGKNAAIGEINKLFFNTVQWNGYHNLGWYLTCDKQTMEFYEHLRQERPDLANYFEREIDIEDPLTGETVDLTYVVGMLSMSREFYKVEQTTTINPVYQLKEKELDTKRYFYTMEVALKNPNHTPMADAQFHAYTDAYFIEKEFGNKNLTIIEKLEEYYKPDGILNEKGRYKRLYEENPDVFQLQFEKDTELFGYLPKIADDMGLYDYKPIKKTEDYNYDIGVTGQQWVIDALKIKLEKEEGMEK